MSRTIRLLLAGVALAGVAPLSSASADPGVDPPCRLHRGEPLLQTTSDFPVPVTVYRPGFVC